MSLADVQRGAQRHVPYRDSRLTYLLQVLRASQGRCERCAARRRQHLACAAQMLHSEIGDRGLRSTEDVGWSIDTVWSGFQMKI